MREAKPSLLFHRGTRYRAHVRGSTNILANRFARAEYPVVWLAAMRHVGQDLPRQLRRTVVTVHDDGVLEIEPYAPFPMLRHRTMPGWLRLATTRLAYRWAIRSVRQAFLDHGRPEPDLIWTTGGDAGSIKSAFRKSKSIVQCVDIYEAYAGRNVVRVELADYASADRIVAVGHSLAEFLVKHRAVKPDRLVVLGQGADLELFSISAEEPEEIGQYARPRLVWVGLLSKADPGLMRAALAALPQGAGCLVLIGPIAPWALELANSDPRVVLCGEMSAAKAAAVLQHCDIGLLLYDRARKPLQYLGQNPLKLYEMAAAGLAIVSTPHAEYAWTNPPIAVVQSEGATVDAVRHSLLRKSEIAGRSLEFAASNGWHTRFTEAERLVLDAYNGPALRESGSS